MTCSPPTRSLNIVAHLLLAASLLWSAASSACIKVPDSDIPQLLIPLQEPTKLVHNQFFLTLLPELLRVTEARYGPCELRAIEQRLSSSRIAIMIRQNNGLSLNWASTSVTREASLRPIRFPLLRGLMGHRIMIVSSEHPDLLKEVTSVEDLRGFLFGLGTSWPDTDILRANGFTVITANHYDLLFKMLSAGRFDVLSRGFNEALPEAELHADKGVVVDPYIVLIYPMPVYFFIAPDNDLLAERLETGLVQLLESGRYEELFYNDPDIRRALDGLNIEGRRKIFICNPTLPDDVPFDSPDLWHFPAQYASCGDEIPLQREPENTN